MKSKILALSKNEEFKELLKKKKDIQPAAMIPQSVANNTTKNVLIELVWCHVPPPHDAQQIRDM